MVDSVPAAYVSGLHQPDYYVKSYLENAIERIRNNYIASKESGDTDISFLRFLFRNNGLDDYNFFDNAVDLFAREEDDSNKLRVFYEWEKKKHRTPYITVNVVKDAMTKNFVNLSGQEVVAVNKGNGQVIGAKIFTPEMNSLVHISYYSKSEGEVRILRHVFKSVLLESNFDTGGLYDATFTGYSDEFKGLSVKEDGEEIYKWMASVNYNYRPLCVGINNFPADSICGFEIEYDIEQDIDPDSLIR